MICPNCKNSIQDYPDYCPFCGTNFKQQGAPQVNAQGMPVNQVNPNVIPGEEQGFVDVVIQRRNAFAGSAVTVHILVDEVEIGQLKNGQYAQYRIPCGTRKVVLKTYSTYDGYLVTFQNDCRNMRIEIGMQMGFWNGSVAMYSVTKEYDNQPPVGIPKVEN